MIDQPLRHGTRGGEGPKDDDGGGRRGRTAFHMRSHFLAENRTNFSCSATKASR